MEGSRNQTKKHEWELIQATWIAYNSFENTKIPEMVSFCISKV